MKLLFLCTGNYYRSRFAEELFNARVVEAGLDWTAQSRGLALERGLMNIGPLSPHVLKALMSCGIQLKHPIRSPKALSNYDMEDANLVIALDEKEHRTLIEERFSKWTDRVTYWQIKDIEEVPPERALHQLELEVGLLVKQLSNQRTML